MNRTQHAELRERIAARLTAVARDGHGRRDFGRGVVPEVRQPFGAALTDVSPEGYVQAIVMNYNRLDDYGTTFAPGCFTESLDQRMPRICWGHDWLDPIGQWTETIEDSSVRLTLGGQLDDFDAVPRARQAFAQMRSGTMNQFSVGFWRLADQPDPDLGPAVDQIIRALLDEASPVLVGAVPDTALLTIRSAQHRGGLVVPVDMASDVLAKVGSGSMDAGEALAQLTDAATPTQDDGEQMEAEIQQTVASGIAWLIGLEASEVADGTGSMQSLDSIRQTFQDFQFYLAVDAQDDANEAAGIKQPFAVPPPATMMTAPVGDEVAEAAIARAGRRSGVRRAH